MQLGLIGHGRLGQLLASYLQQDFDLCIYDSNKEKSTHALEQVAQCRAIILAVPISTIEPICTELSRFDLKDKLIIDTCTVKSYPIEKMLKILPEETAILGTHPMFGPDSARDTLYGAKIVLCKTRIEDQVYKNIKSYLEQHGLLTIESTAEDHDKQIAETLILTHFIGRGLIEFGADHKSIDSKGHRRLMKILLTVQNDAWQLIEDMNKYNKFAGETIDNFMKSLKSVASRIK